MGLTGKQRSMLRTRAQDVDPVITVGKNGLSEDLLAAAEEAFEIHELVKVRFTDHKDSIDELSEVLADKTGAYRAGKTGHVVIMFRQNSDPEKRKVKI